MFLRLFTIASVASLPLCVATGIMWVRSYRASDYFPRERPHEYGTRMWRFASYDGGLWYSVDGVWWPSLEELSAGKSHEPEYERHVIGFAEGAGRQRRVVLVDNEVYLTSRFCRWWRAPYWFTSLITALLPAAYTAARIRRFTHNAPPSLRLCRTCGYDLRASRERCPECGTPIRSDAVTMKNPGISN